MPHAVRDAWRHAALSTPFQPLSLLLPQQRQQARNCAHLNSAKYDAGLGSANTRARSARISLSSRTTAFTERSTCRAPCHPLSALHEDHMHPRAPKRAKFFDSTCAMLLSANSSVSTAYLCTSAFASWRVHSVYLLNDLCVCAMGYPCVSNMGPRLRAVVHHRVHARAQAAAAARGHGGRHLGAGRAPGRLAARLRRARGRQVVLRAVPAQQQRLQLLRAARSRVRPARHALHSPFDLLPMVPASQKYIACALFVHFLN